MVAVSHVGHAMTISKRIVEVKLPDDALSYCSCEFNREREQTLLRYACT